MNAFFSIIVPVYNTEQYLPRCLDSILGQSFADFEVLLIDDGSTDGSGKICDTYAEKDKRICVFHKKNGGVSTARNMGLDNARGEWILFVDSDDYLCEKTSLQSLSKAIVTRPDCELVYFAGQVLMPEGTYHDTLFMSTYDFGYQCLEDNCLKRKSIVFGSIYVQCYKKSVLDSNHLRFENSIWYAEDRLFTCSYYLVAQKTIVIPDVLYCYVVNEHSLMHDEARKKRLDFDQRKAVMLLEKRILDAQQNVPHLKRYIHGLYIQSSAGLNREEIDWRFLLRNASTLKLKLKDALLYLGVNPY